MSPFELCILSLLMALNLFLMQGFWFFGFQGSAAVSLLRALVMGKRKSDSGDASARKAVKEEGEEYVAMASILRDWLFLVFLATASYENCMCKKNLSKLQQFMFLNKKILACCVPRRDQLDEHGNMDKCFASTLGSKDDFGSTVGMTGDPNRLFKLLQEEILGYLRFLEQTFPVETSKWGPHGAY